MVEIHLYGRLKTYAGDCLPAQDCVILCEPLPGDTMQSLQMLSAHVHSGSELVDRSGRDMQLTEESVNNLVELIQKIAAASATQRQISATIRQRTTAIIENVSRTGAYLLGQAEHTDNLAEQAMALVESVSTYRLPEEHDESSPQP